MEDYARIKENIQAMINQGAPEADINEYLSLEGVTVAELNQPQEEQPGVVDGLARGLGLGTRDVAEGITSLPLMVGDAANAAVNLGISGINRIPGVDIPELGYASSSFSDLLTKAGLPTPETTGEKVQSAIQQGAVGALTTMAPATIAKPVSTMGQAVARELATSPATQAIMGGLSGGGSKAAEEAGAGKYGAAAAGLGLAMLGGYGGAKILKNMRGPTAQDVSRQYGRAIDKGISKGIRPTVVGKRNFSQIQQYNKKAGEAVGAIIDESPSLKITDKYGDPVKGGLPKDLRQFSQAIEQSKRNIFKKYDTLAKESLGEIGPDTTVALHKGNRVNPAQIKNELATIDTAIATAKKAAGKVNAAEEAGKFLKSKGYPFRRVAGESTKGYHARVMDDATRQGFSPSGGGATSKKVESLLARKEEYQNILKNLEPEQATVDLAPVVEELEKIATDKVLKDNLPNAAKYAAKRAKALRKRGFYTTEEAQNAVKRINTTLESFYKNPTYDAANTAFTESLVTNGIRRGLDSVIEKAAGPGYQSLRTKYGALKGMEKEVAHRAVVDARKNNVGLGEMLADVASGERAINGLLTFNPVPLAQATGMKGIASYIKRLNDPNRAIKNMFVEAQKLKAKQTY